MNSQPITKADYTVDTIRVHSIFYTIQGEGPFTGRPALFVRLQGCNLRCTWCDTEYTDTSNIHSGDWPEDSLVARITSLIEETCAPNTIVVITGGEPMAQPIGPLVKSLALSDYTVQIETNGTVVAPGFPYKESNVYIVVSPKSQKLASSYYRMEFARKVLAWKYILQWTDKSNDGLPSLSTQVIGSDKIIARPPAFVDKKKIYVSPVDDHGPEYKANVRKVVSVAMKYGYTVNLQTHKILEVE